VLVFVSVKCKKKAVGVGYC